MTPYSYLLAKGMIPILRNLLKLMQEKRPRCPFMSADQCAALYMGYYLKSMIYHGHDSLIICKEEFMDAHDMHFNIPGQNMNSPVECRQKYRDAMFKMSTMKSSTKEFLTELQQYYGRPQRSIPARIKQQLEEFIRFEHMPTEDKVYIPKIPDMCLGYQYLKPPFSEPKVTRKVRRMMEHMKEVNLKENMTAFTTFSRRAKANQEAIKRANEDAQAAADYAQKLSAQARRRMSKMKAAPKEEKKPFDWAAAAEDHLRFSRSLFS